MLKGRQFLAAEIPGVGIAYLPYIIAEMCSRESNVHFKTIRQGPAASIHRVLKGAARFS